MKKIMALTLLMMLTMFSATTAFAAKTITQRVGVVIVGGADYKTKDFYEYVEKYFYKPFASDVMQIQYGKDAQNKYQNFWLDKGYLEEQKPTQKDFIEFVSYGAYDKVIFLKVEDSVSEMQRKRSRLSVNVNVFLVDRRKVLKTASSTNEEDSKASQLRARRGAFKQCAKELSADITPLMK